MGEFDSAFIQTIEHRPKLKIDEDEGIPLIDLSSLKHPESADALAPLVDKVGQACRDWGFFQVINHGVPSQLLRKIEIAAKKFFSLSTEEKRKVRRDEENPLGYFDMVNTKNVRDWKEVFEFTVKDPLVMPASPGHDNQELLKFRNQWPENLPELRVVCEEYAQIVEKLSFKLLKLISLSLGLPAKQLSDFFKDDSSDIRLNHYPPGPLPELALGVGPHKDDGALTVLAQDDVGGLDVKRKADGEWVRIKPIPDSYIINIGDIIQVWSNDKYESAEHRVTLNSERERFSIPFFLYPAPYVMVKPLEELVNKQNPAKYKEHNWGKLFMTKKFSNFKKLNVQNIQLDHFKISD